MLLNLTQRGWNFANVMLYPWLAIQYIIVGTTAASLQGSARRMLTHDCNADALEYETEYVS